MKKFNFTIHGSDFEVEVHGIENNVAKVEVNGSMYDVEIKQEIKTSKTPILVRSPLAQPTRKESKITKTISKTTNTTVKSPLPGTIVAIHVKEGEMVSMGQKLLMLEAMKMENSVLAERDGKVTNIKVTVGQAVMQNDILMDVE